ncbi:MAG: SIS domain-containing protein [Oscillospiraceae bacterium]|nr:SIS domain-containing protein [Oscillospiraceae bacterium]
MSLFERFPMLDCIRDDINDAFEMLAATYENGGKVFCCGNGGSCADADHIVGELMKSFKLKREIDDKFKRSLLDFGTDGELLAQTLEGALPAISLNSHNALSSAFANDKDPNMVYAQILYGLAVPGDTLIALSTSGNSLNCYYAAVTAKAIGVNVIAFTGANDSRLSGIADVTIKVPETETYKVQELHLPVYHWLCAMLEERFFTKSLTAL